MNNKYEETKNKIEKIKNSAIKNTLLAIIKRERERERESCRPRERSDDPPTKSETI